MLVTAKRNKAFRKKPIEYKKALSLLNDLLNKTALHFLKVFKVLSRRGENGEANGLIVVSSVVIHALSVMK